MISAIAAQGPARTDDIWPGDCGKVQRAIDRWKVAGVGQGAVLCYIDAGSGDAVLWWAYEGDGYLVEDTNQRGDWKPLYAFFEHVRSLIAP